MESKEEKKPAMITENFYSSKGETREDEPQNNIKRYKKPLIYVLMAIVFAGCMYLIFVPKQDDGKTEELGMNDAVPQATDTTMQGDKEKAYEAELAEEKEKQKRQALLAMSDYFGKDTTAVNSAQGLGKGNQVANPALAGQKSYQDIRHNLGNFYEDDGEKEGLRREIQDLKREIDNSRETPRNPVQDQLAIMEKSYQMAAKYLPVNAKSTTDSSVSNQNSTQNTQKDNISPIYATEKQEVSMLYREQNDADFVSSIQKQGSSRLFGLDDKTKIAAPKNSIRACVHQTQTLGIGGSVKLRLLEAVRTAKMTIPIGTVLTAFAKLQEGRLQLQITSLENKGNIISVDIIAYDVDGQMGLNLPYSAEANAFKEIASGMSSSSGTNITLSSSTGQQVISDMTKGVVQGASGYLAKKISAPKITLKAGYSLFLLPNK